MVVFGFAVVADVVGDVGVGVAVGSADVGCPVSIMTGGGITGTLAGVIAGATAGGAGGGAELPAWIRPTTPQAPRPMATAAPMPIAQAATALTATDPTTTPPAAVAPAAVAPADVVPADVLPAVMLPEAVLLEVWRDADPWLPLAAAAVAPTTMAGIAGGAITVAADAQAAPCVTTSPATKPATPPSRRRPKAVGLTIAFSPPRTSKGSLMRFSSPTICSYDVRNDSRARIMSTETCRASNPIILAISAGLSPSTALSHSTRR